jgi:alkanesulfonate monooxygenase SsuD/methylene tetrahydromethanopterin reductase-like flavin-dependent oxidoreductase (luciferase family)
MRSHLALGLALDPAGHHPGAWRLPSFDPACMTDADHYVGLGRIAQEAGLDFVLAGYPVRASALPGPQYSQSLQLEPLSLVSALMANLRQIGLAAAVPMAYWEPFNVARAFAALDNLSAGRAAWLAVPSSGADDAANFPRFAAAQIDAPYARADEFVQLTKALWDSWEDDALKFDKANAIFTDRSKVHRIAHQGQFFASDGPLNAPRPVQGHPPILVADASAEGQAFAARHADLVLLPESASRPAGTALVLLDLPFILGETETQAAERRAALDRLGHRVSAGMEFCGTPAGLAELMQSRFESGACDGFTLLPAVMPDDLAAFGADVVPLLRARGLRPDGYGGPTLREILGLARPAGRMTGDL